MATTTENLELTLLSGTDNFDTDTIMENFTKIDTAVGEADSSIGEKDSLTTAAKDNLVAAINEVDGNIGDLSGLTTTAKTNLVAALNEVNQNMSDFEDDLSGKQNKISNQTFKFTPNDAGITTSSIQCFRYGNVCIVTGTFTPNQAGTPLTLGSFNVHPTQNITFPITGYEKVASYGTLSASGVFQCNIPGAMANAPCVINFAFLTA